MKQPWRRRIDVKWSVYGLTVAILLGRMSGLLREYIIARSYGVTSIADAAIVLLAVPDLLTNFLLSSGLSAALVPALTQLGTPRSEHLFWRIYAAVLVGFGVLSILFLFNAQSVLLAFAPGIRMDEVIENSSAPPLVAGAILLTGLAGLATSYLNSQNRYFVAGCGTLLFNCAVISVLLLFNWKLDALSCIGAAIFAGATARWAVQYAALPKRVWLNARLGPRLDIGFIRIFVAGIVSGALMVLAPTILRAASSLLGVGFVATFNYAQKIVELPTGIMLGAWSTIALTRLSECANDSTSFQHTTSKMTKPIVRLSAITAGIGAVLAFPAVAFIFGSSDAISLDDSRRIAMLTSIGLAALPFLAYGLMAVSALNARGRTRDVLRLTAYSLVMLPIFAAPAVVFKSSAFLMLAYVAFQVVWSVALARRQRVLFGGDPEPFASRLYGNFAGPIACVFFFWLWIAMFWLDTPPC